MTGSVKKNKKEESRRQVRKGTGKKSSAGRNSRKKQENTAASANSSENRYEIFFVLVTVLSILLIFSLFGAAGPVGASLNTVTFGLFGGGAYLLPFLIEMGSLFYIANHDNQGIVKRIWGCAGIFIVFTAFIQLINYGNSSSVAYSDIFMKCAKARNGGGMIGGSLAKLLSSAVALAGAWVILIAVFLLLLIFVTNRLITASLRRRAGEARKAFLENAEFRREESSRRADERAELRRVERENKLADARKRAEEERILKAAERARLAEEAEEKRKAAEKLAKEEERRKKEEIIKTANASPDMVEISKKPDFTPPVFHERHFDDSEAAKLDRESEIFIKNAIDEKFGEESEMEPVQEYTEPEPIPVEEASREPEKVIPEPEEDVPEPEEDVPEPEEEVPETESISDEERRKQAILDANTISGNKPPHSFTEEGMTRGEVSDRREENKAIAVSHSENNAKHFNEKKTETVTAKEPEKQEEPEKPYAFPTLDLLTEPKQQKGTDSEELHETARKLEETLKSFGVSVKVTDASCGPAVTRYELHPEHGVKVSRITALSDDIKLNLAASDIRIEAPIPGKAAVGIEVPNKENSLVYFRELIEDEKFKTSKSKVSFAVGKDIAGQTVITDIAKMPHLLIAGATGSGKSVCINTLIMSILYKAKPDEVKFIMIDPKVVELSVYNGIPHLLLPVVTDPKKAAGALAWAVAEMDRRYKEFAKEQVRNIKGYNEKVGNDSPSWMPQIVIIVDELADLMLVAGKEVEDSISRITALARAAGIHLVVATQRPSVNVITGVIKANIPSRIAFQVSSNVDSRTILDSAGAEKLLGKGDMLFAPANLSKPIRVQGAFVSDDEVSNVLDFIRNNNSVSESAGKIEAEIEAAAAAKDSNAGADSENDKPGKDQDAPDDGYDEYFDEAGKLIIEKKKASIGMLQRVYRIGFNRAARIMDQLADAGVVSEEDGTKPRNILMSAEEFAELVTDRHRSKDDGTEDSDDAHEEPEEQDQAYEDETDGESEN